MISYSLRTVRFTKNVQEVSFFPKNSLYHLFTEAETTREGGKALGAGRGALAKFQTGG